MFPHFRMIFMIFLDDISGRFEKQQKKLASRFSAA